LADSKNQKEQENKGKAKHKMSATIINVVTWLLLISLILVVTEIIHSFFPRPIDPLRSDRDAYGQCQSNCKNMGVALDMYAGDNDGHFPPALNCLAPDYLREIPTCAGCSSSQVYVKSYESSLNSDIYTFYCMGKNHKNIGIPPNYPQYSSIYGLIRRPTKEALLKKRTPAFTPEPSDEKKPGVESGPRPAESGEN